MTQRLSVRELQNMGFDWPRYAIIEKYSIVDDGRVDLIRTLEAMQSSRSFYSRQINQAFNFKQQTGADYSDFTDRFDEYARMNRDLGVAIAYLTQIIDAVKGLGARDDFEGS